MRDVRKGSTGVNPDIHLDIDLDDPLSPSCFAHIVKELLKNLLHQRHQIPLPFERIKSDVRSLERRNPEVEIESETLERLSIREKVKHRQSQVRQATLEKRFHRVASNFVANLETLLQNLTETIINEAGDQLKCVSIILGATPLSPKEIYHVPVPTFLAGEAVTPPSDSGDSVPPVIDSNRARKKANLRLFRAMVNHEQFFTQTGQPLALTNVFIALKRRSQWISPEWLTPKDEFVNVRRGHRVFFNFHNAPETLDLPQRKKLRFADDPAATPIRSENAEYEEGRYTPMPMDLCTPAPVNNLSRGRRPSGPDMVETPCHFNHTESLERSAFTTHPAIPSAPVFERDRKSVV